ncbi:MAG TPA: single-stranded DNA-binding protein [Parachlamydiales bacterium]|nr:single-stranded DNA-binding protein [Parachlamydiales bacterium]HCJ84230.1 single-stranded DNA-binding protein [Parachlamydiales bacterium]
MAVHKQSLILGGEMNQITIGGHLGADPEVRFTSSGQKVTTLRVAAKTRRGSNKEDTIWWRVTIWGEQFDKMIPYFKKGSSIIVLGELSKPEIFTDREGHPQVSMNITAYQIQFSPFGRTEREKESSASATPGMAETATVGAQSLEKGQGEGAFPAFNEDEIPF